MLTFAMDTFVVLKMGTQRECCTEWDREDMGGGGGGERKVREKAERNN